MNGLAVIILAAAVSGDQATPPDAGGLTLHEIAIKQFSSTLAMADVASRQCADIYINMSMLDEFRDRLGVGIKDQAALKREGAFALEVLDKAFKEAPSPQAWCDAAYRMYGPEGRLIPGFMVRSATPPSP